MAKTRYCKKCGIDVPDGEACPVCGKTPPANTARIAWAMPRNRAADWMSWNEVMRIAVPVLSAVVLLGLLIELLLGGFDGVVNLIRGGFLLAAAALLLLTSLLTLLIFLLGGRDELFCVADSKGFHVRTVLPGATKLKIRLHGKPVSLMDSADLEGRVILGEKELAWKDIARVQLWTEKRMMLLYSPRWWMRLSLPILLAKWNDVLTLTDEKLGRKKAVELPKDWVKQLPPKREEKPKPTDELDLSIVPPQTTLPQADET